MTVFRVWAPSAGRVTAEIDGRLAELTGQRYCTPLKAENKQSVLAAITGVLRMMNLAPS